MPAGSAQIDRVVADIIFQVARYAFARSRRHVRSESFRDELCSEIAISFLEDERIRRDLRLLATRLGGDLDRDLLASKARQADHPRQIRAAIGRVTRAALRAAWRLQKKSDRASRRRTRLVEDDTAAEAKHAGASEDALAPFLGSLSPLDRNILEDRVLGRLKFKTIARKYELPSAAAARQRYHRTLAKLKAVMEKSRYARG